MKSPFLNGGGVSLPFIPMILLPWNATEHAHVWSACIAVIAFGAKKMKP